MNRNVECIFKEACQVPGLTNDHSNHLWMEISEAYSARSRTYHNLDHLQAVISELNAVRAFISDWNLLVFAVAYHDFVYNVIRNDNEKRSAEKAEKELVKAGVGKEKLLRCRDLIMATKTHETAADLDTAYFVDADLSVLGYDSEKYQDYCMLIRKEYRYYPDLLYIPGRRKVLHHFLSMKRIYKTDFFYRRYESQARINLLQELNELN